MDAVFYFHFHDHTEDVKSLRSLAFYVDNITTAWDELDFKMGCAEGAIEAQYGAHWAEFMLTSVITGIKLIGYSSLDIHGEKCQRVMDVWRTTFLSIANGCVVSEVYDVTNVGFNFNVEVSQYVKDAYDQQQAELLRLTLTDHVKHTGALAPSKKI